MSDGLHDGEVETTKCKNCGTIIEFVSRRFIPVFCNKCVANKEDKIPNIGKLPETDWN